MIKSTYIHIPFCKKKCNYCAFCSFNLLSAKEKYINTLLKEIKFLYKNELQKTIYLGGGTPSILEIKEIEQILNCFNFSSMSEITIEMNPIDANLNKLKALKDIGINRISLGVQSFDDNLLKIIGRNHSKNDILKAIENIKKANFNNYSIDLMYGLPQQTKNDWEKTLVETLSIQPNHISLYGLKIENGTYFYKNPPKKLPNQDIQAKMYEIAIDKLKENYLHYEFSSFAKNNKYISKHNSTYWERNEYYGFGLSASGFIKNKRYTNTFNFQEYINNPYEKKYEKLSQKEALEEEIFLGLRLSKGIDFNKINKKYNIDIYKKFKNQFDKMIENNFAIKTQKGIKLTLKGIMLSNEILCDFIEI